MDFKFGNLIEDMSKVHKDAVHVAVAPVEAGWTLYPGQRITLSANKAVAATTENAIGIVDPFLDTPIFPGQKFWMMMLPGVVQNLRHEWDHPNFNTVEAPSAPLKAKVDVTDVISSVVGAVGSGANDPEGESKRWMEDFARKYKKTYNQVMGEAESYSDYAVVTYDPYNDYSGVDFAEFWKHYYVLKNKPFKPFRTHGNLYTDYNDDGCKGCYDG